MNFVPAGSITFKIHAQGKSDTTTIIQSYIEFKSPKNHNNGMTVMIKENGKNFPLFQTNPKVFISTDASEVGRGAQTGNIALNRTWPKNQELKRNVCHGVTKANGYSQR